MAWGWMWKKVGEIAIEIVIPDSQFPETSWSGSSTLGSKANQPREELVDFL